MILAQETNQRVHMYISTNGICEIMHETVGNVLKTLIHTKPPGNLNNANMSIGSALVTATASHAFT